MSSDEDEKQVRRRVTEEASGEARDWLAGSKAKRINGASIESR